MKSKLTDKIAVAYYGSKVLLRDDPQALTGTILGVHGYNLYIASSTHLLLKEIGDCELILNPISKISDKQAIDIATIMCNGYGGINKSPTVERVDDRIKVWTGGRGVCSIWFNGELNWSDVENHNLNTSMQARQAYDYCRKNSIDVGYEEIPSLIKAGIAVKSTNV